MTCPCFTCTHRDPGEQYAYYTGYVEASDWFLNWAKKEKIVEGHIGDDDLPGIVAQIRFNRDESECYRRELAELLKDHPITPEAMSALKEYSEKWWEKNPDFAKRIESWFEKLVEDSNEAIIRCDCGCELLVINHIEGDFELTMFTAQYDRYTLWQRLRHIWHILIHGKPYTDQIILSRENAKKLAKFIITKTKLDDQIEIGK